jgi:hypothetical protein
MLHTAQTIGTLPGQPETPAWLPVDLVAQTVFKSSLSSTGSIVSNVVNQGTFRWTKNLLPNLHKARFCFLKAEPCVWLQKLRHPTQTRLSFRPSSRSTSSHPSATGTYRHRTVQEIRRAKKRQRFRLHSATLRAGPALLSLSTQAIARPSSRRRSLDSSAVSTGGEAGDGTGAEMMPRRTCWYIT